MRIWDTFLFRDELDMLECRLYELQETSIYRHVIVEAPVDHQGHPKPLVFMENQERFAPWRDRIIYVAANDLAELPAPTAPPHGTSAGAAPPEMQGHINHAWARINAQREAVWQGLRAQAEGRPYGTPEFWLREHVQREHVADGLSGVEPGDVIMHSDLDEIITPAGVKQIENLQGWGLKFDQRSAIFAVDWELPWGWKGPVAARMEHVVSFVHLRDYHGYPVAPEGGGWHLTWLGGEQGIREKMDSYCHNEMDAYIERGLGEQQFYERGIFWGHGQGDTQLIARDVDESWPRWVYERKCPDNWFRPRR